MHALNKPMRFFYSPPGQPPPYLRLPSLPKPDVLGRADSDVEAHDASSRQGRDGKNCRVYGRRWWILLCTYVAWMRCFFLISCCGRDFFLEKTYQKHKKHHGTWCANSTSHLGVFCAPSLSEKETPLGSTGPFCSLSYLGRNLGMTNQRASPHEWYYRTLQVRGCWGRPLLNIRNQSVRSDKIRGWTE